jgi:hypothetical protein
MAIINITPLSFGGVQAPTNLLAELLGGPINPQNLLYPIDLATNPTYGHAVQFTIFDYESSLPGVLGEAAGLFNGVKDIFSSVSSGNYTKAFTDGANFLGGGFLGNQLGLFGDNNGGGGGGGTGSSPANLLQTATSLTQASTYRLTKGAPLATISLYMPDTVNTTYNSNYTEMSLTSALGAKGLISNAIADKKFMGSVGKGDVAQILQSPQAKALGSYAIGAATGLGSGVVGQALGQVVNPQMQLIYQGIGLRDFQLEFIFTPVSSQEAKTVEKIVDAFVYYSVPDYVADTKGQYLKPPQIFNMNFVFTGQPSVLGAITNVLTSTLTNVLGSQLTSALIGGDASTITNAPKAKTFQVGDCVLKNVNVDYAPNGWAAYNDGYPIQTRLTLQFQEMDIVTKTTMNSQGKGFSNFNFGSSGLTDGLINGEVLPGGTGEVATGVNDISTADRS